MVKIMKRYSLAIEPIIIIMIIMIGFSCYILNSIVPILLFLGLIAISMIIGVIIYVYDFIDKNRRYLIQIHNLESTITRRNKTLLLAYVNNKNCMVKDKIDDFVLDQEKFDDYLNVDFLEEIEFIENFSYKGIKCKVFKIKYICDELDEENLLKYRSSRTIFVYDNAN